MISKEDANCLRKKIRSDGLDRNAMMELQKFVRSIPDFPKKGIMFRDITTVLKDKRAFADAVGQFHQLFKDARIDKVAAVESRGFIVGGALADRLGAGFVPIRNRNSARSTSSSTGPMPSKFTRTQFFPENGY
jgi:adenine/guanine phosphoribosyltransferase-like PRPP-binding protein